MLDPALATARSGLPSPLKSPSTMKYGSCPTAISDRTQTGAAIAVAIWKATALDVPPPGDGLITVIKAVPEVEMSDVGIAAVNSVSLTKAVGRGLPFQFTTDVEVKPEPFTVSVNADPPGTAASGRRGKSTVGTA